MVDSYILAGLSGLACIGYGFIKWRQDRYYGFAVASKETLAAIGLVLGERCSPAGQQTRCIPTSANRAWF
jgi:hypothetical protein